MEIMMTKDTPYLDLKEDDEKMIPLIVWPNPKLQFDTTHNQKFSWWSFQDVSKITDRVES